MMDKNRDTEEIELFCTQFENFAQSVSDSARRLKAVAGDVEESLPDELGTRATGRVQEFTDKIIELLEQGSEPVKKLRKTNREMEDEVNGLLRKMG